MTSIRPAPGSQGKTTFTYEIGNTEYTVTGFVTNFEIRRDFSGGPMYDASGFSIGLPGLRDDSVRVDLNGCQITQRRIHAEPHYRDRSRHQHSVCVCKCDRCLSTPDPEGNGGGKCICVGCECNK